MTSDTLHGGSSWSRLIGSGNRRALVAVGLSVSVAVVAPVVVIAAGFSLGVLDPLRNLNNPVAAAAAASKAAHAAAVAKLPALVDLTDAVTHGPPGWAGNGALTSGVSLPTVINCVPSPITPVVTVGRGFTVGSAQVTVTLAAYVAGAGGLIFNSQFSGIPACSVPGGSSTVAAGPADGPGVSRFSISTSQAGALTTTQVWRRGDVIAYLSETQAGPDASNEAGLASTMDQTLTKALGSDCVNQNSLATDNVRDPFAVFMRSDFRGLTVDQGIDQSPTPLPSPTTIEELVTVPVAGASTVPTVSGAPALPGSPASPASPGTAVVQSPTAVPVTQGPLGVTLPAPAVAVTPSRPPWPVYPPLPSLLPAPIPPSAPSTGPPTHASLRESQVDSLGPGCGWAFTGMLAPTPPTILPADVLAARQAALQPLLSKAQAAWQISVNAYWVAYTGYLTQAENYATFTDQVNQVSAAWSVIDGQWETYFTLKAAYEQMVTDHNSFLKAQAAALAAYNANQASCTPTDAAPPAAAPPAAAPPAAAPPAPGDTAAPADESGPHARSAASDSPSPSATASASPSSGGGLLPPPPVATASASATPSPTVSAAPTDTAPAPATDMPTAAATTAPPPAPVFGIPCESPPAILMQTPPAAPTGPPPTKPADPRPKPSPSGSPSGASSGGASASPSAAPSHR